jgi:hypothetical protein
MMITTDALIQIMVNGVFTGFSVAIGSYFANKHILERLEKAIKRNRRGD